MTISIVLQFVVVLAAIWMGARSSGVGLGLWGAVGLLVLVVGFGVNPTSPPIDVMLIILAVIMAASVMDAAGGIDYLVRIACPHLAHYHRLINGWLDESALGVEKIVTNIEMQTIKEFEGFPLPSALPNRK